MAVTPMNSEVLSANNVPDMKVNPIIDVQAIDVPTTTDTLPVPPELPDITQPANLTLPITIDGFSPEKQATITAHIEKHYPDIKTEFEIETVLDIMLHVVSDASARNAQSVAMLSVTS